MSSLAKQRFALQPDEGVAKRSHMLWITPGVEMLGTMKSGLMPVCSIAMNPHRARHKA